VPEVALHLAPSLRDRRAGQGMPAVRIAAGEASRVGEQELAVARRHRCAIRVAHHRARGEGGGLRLARQRDRAVGVDVPGMEQVRRPVAHGQQFLLGQAGAIVLGRETRDLVRGLDRLAQRAEAEVAAARVTAALADVDRHAEGLVARLLDGLSLALEDIYCAAGVLLVLYRSNLRAACTVNKLVLIGTR